MQIRKVHLMFLQALQVLLKYEGHIEVSCHKIAYFFKDLKTFYF